MGVREGWKNIEVCILYCMWWCVWVYGGVCVESGVEGLIVLFVVMKEGDYCVEEGWFLGKGVFVRSKVDWNEWKFKGCVVLVVVV